VQSATAEQVFEAAADNITHAAKAGYISGAQATNAISQILAAGQQNLSTLAQQNPKAKGGLTNLTNTIQGNLQAVSAIGNATQAFDPNAVSSLFVPTNAKGWESGATAAGAERCKPGAEHSGTDIWAIGQRNQFEQHALQHHKFAIASAGDCGRSNLSDCEEIGDGDL